MLSQTEAMFASTSSDGTVCVWELVFPLTSRGKPEFPMSMTLFTAMVVFPLSKLTMSCFILLGDCELSCLDSFSIGSKSMVALSLAELPGDIGQIVLAMGGLDNKIHLYCGGRTGKVYSSS